MMLRVPKLKVDCRDWKELNAHALLPSCASLAVVSFRVVVLPVVVVVVEVVPVAAGCPVVPQLPRRDLEHPPREVPVPLELKEQTRNSMVLVGLTVMVVQLAVPDCARSHPCKCVLDVVHGKLGKNSSCSLQGRHAVKCSR